MRLTRQARKSKARRAAEMMRRLRKQSMPSWYIYDRLLRAGLAIGDDHEKSATRFPVARGVAGHSR